MKQTIFTLILTLLFIGCKEKAKKTTTVLNYKKEADTIKLHKLKKLFINGDFDGDGVKDTIFEHNYSRLTRAEIDSSANPFEHEWQTTVVNWFYKQDPDLYLTFNKKHQDTLHLGAAQGLYCLINIGDNNSDGKDEIAFVIDKLDYSPINSCKIYSLCNKKWTLLKEFEIHEDAFNFTGEKPPVFNEIKEYLEKKNGNWFYIDYHQEFDSPEDVGKMMQLKTEQCN